MEHSHESFHLLKVLHAIDLLSTVRRLFFAYFIDLIDGSV